MLILSLPPPVSLAACLAFSLAQCLIQVEHLRNVDRAAHEQQLQQIQQEFELLQTRLVRNQHSIVSRVQTRLVSAINTA